MATRNPNASFAGEREKPVSKPRYTVELTTEGWQIKDNVTGSLKADAFESRRTAELEARNLTLDTAEREALMTTQLKPPESVMARSVRPGDRIHSTREGEPCEIEVLEAETEGRKFVRFVLVEGKTLTCRPYEQVRVTLKEFA